MNEIFRLKRLQIKNHFILGEKDILFFNPEDKGNEPYTTIIIGINGSGKSQILRFITDLFREVESISKGSYERYTSGNYYLEYFLGKDEYAITNNPVLFQSKFPSKERIFRNGVPVSISEFTMPSNLIVTSVLLNDSFPFFKSKQESFYQYLGIRRSPSVAGTRTQLTKAVENLLNSIIQQPGYNDFLKKLLDFLELDSQLIISYNPRYKERYFTGNLSLIKFNDYFENWVNYGRFSKPYYLPFYSKLTSDEKIEIVKFLNSISNKLKYIRGKRSGLLEIEIIDNPEASYILTMAKKLHSLDIISFPEIKIRKGVSEKLIGNKLNFQNYGQAFGFPISSSSSGENHLLSSFLGILSKIQHSAIILLDEPEISLHPNWQMKYINFLKLVFKEFTSCHFIIASHSHFIVSDLKPDSSTIISLQKNLETGKFDSVPITSNTYGWSAEEILLSVFKTPSSRNYYLTNKLEEIFELISKEPTKERIEIIKDRVLQLKKLDLTGINEQDPLKEILQTLFKKFANG